VHECHMDDRPPLKGAWSGSRDPFFISMPAILSPERPKRVAKFCMRVEYSMYSPWNDKLSRNGRGQSQVTRFLKLCPNHIFGVRETRCFKCRVLIDTEVY